jgi:cytochrome c-type biogenesis protein CcmH/NrfG
VVITISNNNPFNLDYHQPEQEMAKKNREQKAPVAEQPKAVPPKSKNQLFIYFVIFVFGFLAGIAFTVMKSDTPSAGAPAVAEDKEHIHDEETDQAILNLEAEVTANPDDYEAWTRLGHLYFDTNHPDKAIGAYTKSLSLHSGNADLLTDLGVMYRRNNQPQEALETFDKAIAKDPKHMPSRFNKGIVLLFDLDDQEGAIASWEFLLTIDPDAKTGNGEPIRDFIDRVKAEQENNKNQ